MKKIIDFVFLLLSVLVVVGVNTFAKVCGNMMGMEAPCHTTRTYAVVVGIIVAVISVIDLVVKINWFGSLTKAIQLVGSIAIILTPTVIAPVCKMETMHCSSHTKPFLILVGVVGTIIAIGRILGEGLKAKGARDE
ncbi:MAG: DUF4418 family protein [Eubacterium sp.]|nr:DUF4418 family protein [Eubacterium sp.]